MYQNLPPSDNTEKFIITGNLESFIKSQNHFDNGFGEIFVGVFRFERKHTDEKNLYRMCTDEVYQSVRFLLRKHISDFEEMNRHIIKLYSRYLCGHNEYNVVEKTIDISISKKCIEDWNSFFEDCSYKQDAVKEMQIKLQEHKIPFVINSIN